MQAGGHPPTLVAGWQLDRHLHWQAGRHQAGMLIAEAA